MNEDLELMMSEIPANMTMDEVDDYLCHYGVKDQKHGVRRYQNLDGSLTPLGRLHYGIGFKNIGQVEAARRAKEKAKKEKEENERKKKEDKRKAAVEKATRSGKAEDIYRLRESMTDEELYRAVTRMQSTQKLESALASIENERFSALNRETKQAKESKKSIFEKARDKKAEKQAKEKAEAEAKKQQAMEALNKGMAVLDTVTKTTNSIVGAYQSYNKMASMINSLGGDKLPSQLPTWDTEPWKKPNDGKTDKGKKQETQKLADSKTQEPKSSQIGKKDWSVKSTYSQPSYGFSTGSTWTTDSKKETPTPSHTSSSFTGSTKKDWTTTTPSHTSSPFTGSKNSYWTASTPSHTSSPFSGSSSKDWTDSKKSSKSSDPLVSMLDSFTSPGSYSTTQITDAIKSGASLASIEKMTSSYSASDAKRYCDSLVSSYSVESGWEKWKKSSSGFGHSEEEDLEDGILCHYGRKDQKWGVRRYQNLDGSLTEEGRIRYSKARKEYGMDNPDGKLDSYQNQIAAEAALKFGSKFGLTQKSLHMSDAEIRRSIEKEVSELEKTLLPRLVVEYANEIAIGKEVLNRMAVSGDTKIGEIRLTSQPSLINYTQGMKWRVPKKYRK